MRIRLKQEQTVIDMREVRCASLSCMSRNDAWRWAWIPAQQQEPWFCTKECAEYFEKEQLLEAGEACLTT